MDDHEARQYIVDIPTWVERARTNPVEFERRKAVEVVLSALSHDHELVRHLFLKGGALMDIGYETGRLTKDVDFTTDLPIEGFQEFFSSRMKAAFPRACARLGYLDMRLGIQSSKMDPPGEGATRPTLRLKIGYARANTNQEKRLAEGKAANAVRLDVSFNEPVTEFETMVIGGVGREGIEDEILVYSWREMIAEKFRALLQQEPRNRHRGQDVYDIARLLENRVPSDEDRLRILSALRTKSAARDIFPERESLRRPEVAENARPRYEELLFELAESPLDFERDFDLLTAFFESLPWSETAPPGNRPDGGGS